MKNKDKVAYPCDGPQYDDKFKGLTKREYFAGVAMQGLLSNSKSTKNKSNIFIRFLQLFFPTINLQWAGSCTDDLAKSSIKYADELLNQLEETEQ